MKARRAGFLPAVAILRELPMTARTRSACCNAALRHGSRGEQLLSALAVANLTPLGSPSIFRCQRSALGYSYLKYYGSIAGD